MHVKNHNYVIGGWNKVNSSLYKLLKWVKSENYLIIIQDTKHYRSGGADSSLSSMTEWLLRN